MKKHTIISLVFLFSFSGIANAGNAQVLQAEVSRVIPEQVSVSCKDGKSNVGKEVQCVMRIKKGFPRNPRDYHDLQELSRDVAVAIRNAGLGYDFSISSHADNEVPIARFIYSAQFDYLTPIYMWR